MVSRDQRVKHSYLRLAGSTTASVTSRSMSHVCGSDSKLPSNILQGGLMEENFKFCKTERSYRSRLESSSAINRKGT